MGTGSKEIVSFLFTRLRDIMIYSNRMLSTGVVKLPVLPTGFVWNIFSQSTGEAFIEILDECKRPVGFGAKLPHTDESSRKVVEVTAFSVMWDFMSSLEHEEDEFVCSVVSLFV